MKHPLYLIIFSLLCFTCCKDLEEKINPPIAKEATHVHSKGFTANWESQNGASHFLLYVSEDADFSSYLSGYEGKEVNGTSHEVNGLQPEHTYYYQVREKHGDHHSKLSNIVEVQTHEHSLDAPTALKIEELGYDYLKIKWDEVPEAKSYVLEVAYDEDFEYYVKGLHRKVVSENHAEIKYLSSKTKYHIRVRAVKDNLWSRYSQTMSCETSEHPYMIDKLVYTATQAYYEERILIEEIIVKLHRDPYTQRVKKASINSSDYSFPMGEPEGSESYDVHFTYDEWGRLKTTKVGHSTTTYHYDKYGKITSTKTSSPDGSSSTYYTYSEDSKEIYVSDSFGETYRFDAYGNLTEGVELYEDYNEVTFEIGNYYTYEDTKYPKDMNLATLSIRTQKSGLYNNGIPEAEIPVWVKQVCNITKVKGIANEYGEEHIFEYIYNDDKFPLSRSGVYETYLGAGGETYFTKLEYHYVNGKNHEDHHQVAANQE